MRTLTREEARRIAVRAAGLEERDAPDLIGMVRELAGLRIELTTTVAAAHDHVAITRLGDEYRADDAMRALANGRLFERDWMLRPSDELGLYLAGMRDWLDRSGTRDWVDANAHFRHAILERIGDEGPLTSREIPDESAVPWFSTGWTRDQNVTKMLQLLHGAGELAVIGHRGRLRVFDLAENVFPSVVEVPRAEAARIRAEKLLAVFGVWRDGASRSYQDLHDVPPVGELVEIDGVDGRWRVDAEALARVDEPLDGRVAILSPFDRLVFDRERLVDLFEHPYVLEQYKPKPTRRFGSTGFGLPVLAGDRFVATVDARADRKRGTLTLLELIEAGRVSSSGPMSGAERDAVRASLEELARALGLTLVDAP